MPTHRHWDAHHCCEQVYSQRLLLGMEAQQRQTHHHLLDLPGCWKEFENYDFFLNLNLQNASLLSLENFEVETYLALSRVFYIGGSENLYSSH